MTDNKSALKETKKSSAKVGSSVAKNSKVKISGSVSSVSVSLDSENPSVDVAMEVSVNHANISNVNDKSKVAKSIVKTDSSQTKKVFVGKFGRSLMSDDVVTGKIKIPSEAFSAVGKRKSAVAKTWLWKSDGKQKSLVINGRSAKDYFDSSPTFLSKLSEPFVALNESIDDYCIVATLIGGGVSAQAEALRLGLSKLLAMSFPHLRHILKSLKLLTRDSRIVEEKKTGLRKARKREQFSKR